MVNEIERAQVITKMLRNVLLPLFPGLAITDKQEKNERAEIMRERG